jgi:hypothetical protein
MADYATLLRDQVTLTCRSIDRVFLQAYVPKLQSVGLVCRFLRWPRGFRMPSSAALGKIGAAYVPAPARRREPDTRTPSVPGMVHVWSTIHWNRAVRSGLQWCILVQVAGGILRVRGRVQNPDKDEGGGSSPPRPTIPP